jgi:shikimate dehydrogenase
MPQRSGEAGSIVLIGFMGSGKTTIGRALADLLGFRFVDTDDIVESRAGRTIRQIFDQDGEAKFRAREHTAVKQAVRVGERVIACGGGAILQLRNHRLLKEAGPVVYLRADLETLRVRLRGSKTRPLLRARGALERLLAERAPAYEAAADVVVDVDRGTPEEIAERIAEALL